MSESETPTAKNKRTYKKYFVLYRQKWTEADDSGSDVPDDEQIGVFESEEEVVRAFHEMKEFVNKVNHDLTTNPILDKKNNNILKRFELNIEDINYKRVKLNELKN